MFRRKRHINAKNNEWYVIHRGNNNPRPAGQIVITGLAWLIVAGVVLEVLKAVLPYLLVIAMIGGAGLAFLNRRSS